MRLDPARILGRKNAAGQNVLHVAADRDDAAAVLKQLLTGHTAEVVFRRRTRAHKNHAEYNRLWCGKRPTVRPPFCWLTLLLSRHSA